MSATGTVRLPHDPTSAATVRRRVGEELAPRVRPRLVEDVSLVASELVGNAVRHASPLPGGEVLVSWELRDHGVEVRVTDGGASARPQRRSVSPHDLSGRGLSIVDRVARDWGVEASDQTTTVWAVVDDHCNGVPVARSGMD